MPVAREEGDTQEADAEGERELEMQDDAEREVMGVVETMGDREVERVDDKEAVKDVVEDGLDEEVPPPNKGLAVARALPMSMKRNDAYRWSFARVVQVSWVSGKGTVPSSTAAAEKSAFVILHTHPLRHARSVSINHDPEPKRGSGSVEEEK